MEELIYILPFDQYGISITATLSIIALILIAICLRLLKVPHKIMAIFMGIMSVMVLLFYQTDGTEELMPLVNLPKRQKQLNQQLAIQPLPINGAELRHIRVRFHSLVLGFSIKQDIYQQQDSLGLKQFAQNFIRNNGEKLCQILKLEQESPYRKNNNLINLTINDFVLNFNNDNAQYSIAYKPQDIGYFLVSEEQDQRKIKKQSKKGTCRAVNIKFQ